MEDRDAFAHKDTIKAFGGQWDGNVKRWFVPEPKHAECLAAIAQEKAAAWSARMAEVVAQTKPKAEQPSTR